MNHLDQPSFGVKTTDLQVQKSFPNGRRSRVAGRGSRVAGFKSRVAGFEKVAGFQKSRVFKRLHYRNITKNKIYTL